MYARFRASSSFYKVKDPLRSAYGVRPNSMRSLDIKPELRKGIVIDERIDLRSKERLEMLEAMRHPKERDFYQDHTYHNQWLAREMEAPQRTQLATRYQFMAPNFVRHPWIWYPGDVVEITSGESRGQRGAIIAVIKHKNELLVQNINVQDVVIPASETRPEQLVQREHPISVDMVQHVDPQTNEKCSVRLVTVRNKETGALEEKRISLDSGVLMPIPSSNEAIEAGDPLKDTPIQDADEPTYDPEAELSVLVERKLRAIENHFVSRLKRSYEFHSKLTADNELAMRQFQRDVVDRASETAVEALHDSMGAEWWAEEVEPIIEELEAAELEAKEAAASGAAASSSQTAAAVDDVVEDDVEEDDVADARTSEPDGESRDDENTPRRDG